MKDYKILSEKITLSPRMQSLMDQIRPRLRSQNTREGTHTSPVEAEGKNPFLDVFTENPDAPYVINLANAIVRSWEVTPCVIFPHEAIAGITRPDYPLMEHFSWGIRGVREILKKTTDLSDEKIEALASRMEPLSYQYLDDAHRHVFGEERYWAYRGDVTFGAGGYQGHTVPSYERLLENGLDGMLSLIDHWAEKNAVDSESADFYEACRIIIRGMSRFLESYSAEAARLAALETDEVQKSYYEAIAANCAAAAHKKPETLYEAVQLMWTLSLWDWVDCVGRIDQYLYPFYEKAIREGDVIPAEDSVASIIFKLWENGCHNLTLSGVRPEDGTDATTELTYLILQILRVIHDTHPRMSLRIHEGTPEELLLLAVAAWSEGMSDPSLVSDKTVIGGLERIGVPTGDARNYTMLGCQEIEIPGMSNFGCEDGRFNVAKILEYALRGGRSTSAPEVQLGPDTGDFASFETFEDFFAAFEEQLRFFVGIFCPLCNNGQEIRAANYAKLVKTPFTVGCLERGKPHDAGGPIYNFGVVETVGFSATADSMTAIKKLVFDEKKISRETLSAALKANFEGYEKERQMLLNKAPKFGNDDKEADEMAVRVLNLFWDECAKYRSVRGDVFTGACSLLDGGVSYGKYTGALPDGRFAGEPLGNSIGPRPGADRSGLSAMLSSVSKLPLEKGVGGTTLNVILTTKLLSNPALRKNIAATLKAYLLTGGQMAQVTTANLEDLVDAQKHPERHGDLIVRIGGFSVQFVQLDKRAQDEIISRYGV